MTQRRRSRSSLDALMLALVLVFPLLAILWYFFGQQAGQQNAGAPPPSETTSTAAPLEQAPAQVALSLDDASALPTMVAAAQIVPFSFTIQNPGSAAATYQYKVTVVWNDGEEDIIDENTATVAAGGSTDVPESLKFETASDIARITIEVEDPEQQINFMLPRS